MIRFDSAGVHAFFLSLSLSHLNVLRFVVVDFCFFFWFFKSCYQTKPILTHRSIFALDVHHPKINLVPNFAFVYVCQSSLLFEHSAVSNCSKEFGEKKTTTTNGKEIEGTKKMHLEKSEWVGTRFLAAWLRLITRASGQIKMFLSLWLFSCRDRDCCGRRRQARLSHLF